MSPGIVKVGPQHQSQVDSKTIQNIAGQFSQMAVLISCQDNTSKRGIVHVQYLAKSDALVPQPYIIDLF